MKLFRWLSFARVAFLEFSPTGQIGGNGSLSFSTLHLLTWSESGKLPESLRPLLQLCALVGKHLFNNPCCASVLTPTSVPEPCEEQVSWHCGSVCFVEIRVSLRNPKQIAGKNTETRHREGVRLIRCCMKCPVYCAPYITSIVWGTRDTKTNKRVLASRSSCLINV